MSEVWKGKSVPHVIIYDNRTSPNFVSKSKHHDDEENKNNETFYFKRCDFQGKVDENQLAMPPKGVQEKGFVMSEVWKGKSVPHVIKYDNRP